MSNRADYAYLLRMWQTRDGERAAWHASLQQPGTQEHRGFATLDDLFDFLRRQACLPQEQRAAPPGDQVVNNMAETTDL